MLHCEVRQVRIPLPAETDRLGQQRDPACFYVHRGARRQPAGQGNAHSVTGKSPYSPRKGAAILGEERYSNLHTGSNTLVQYLSHV